MDAVWCHRAAAARTVLKQDTSHNMRLIIIIIVIVIIVNTLLPAVSKTLAQCVDNTRSGQNEKERKNGV